MQELTLVVGLHFKVLGDALAIDRDGCASHRLAIGIGHFPVKIPGLCEAGNGDEHCHHEEGQDFICELH